MPKAPAPSQTLKFHGRFYYTPETEHDDWGLSPEQQETYVELFRRKLVAKGAYKEDLHDFFLLRRFLRARSYDLEKATLMFMNNQEWRREHKADTILQDFSFPERDEFIDAWPQGYHKIDKIGRPIYIQLLGKIDLNKMKKITTVDRMIQFHIYEYERCCRVILPICSKLAGRNIDTTFGIMDVRGVSMSQMTAEVRRIMGVIFKYDADNYPEMLGHICLVNAPVVFRAVWAMVKGLLDPRTQGKIEILGPSYKQTLLKHIREEDLSELFGGTSKGTLQDDSGPWNDPAVIAQLGVDVEELRRGNRQTPFTILPSTGSSRAYNSMGGLSNIVRASHTNQILEPTPEDVISDGREPTEIPQENEPTPSDLKPTVDITDVVKRVRPIIERIGVLEGHVQALRAQTNSSQTDESMLVTTAKEGSLVYRVEVLESAISTILAAQAEMLKKQEQADEQAEALRVEQETVNKKACCVVM